MEGQLKKANTAIVVRIIVLIFLSTLLMWFFSDFYYARYPSLQISKNLIQTKSFIEIGIFCFLIVCLFLPVLISLYSKLSRIKVNESQQLLIKDLKIKLVSHFLDVGNLNFSLNNSLKDIGQTTQSNRAYLYKFNQNSNSFHITNQWTKEDLSPLSKTQQIDAKDYPSLVKVLNTNQPAYFEKPFDALDENSSILMKNRQASSIYIFPITTPTSSRYLLILENISLLLKNALQSSEFTSVFSYIIGMLERYDLAKQIERLSTLKTKFIETVSSQLQNPLKASKQGLTDLLLHKVGKLTESQKKVVSILKDSLNIIENKISIMKTVLDYETDKIILDKTSVNLADIVESQISLLKDMFNLKDQKVSFVKPKISTNVFADKEKIAFAVKTLIENACVYSHRYTEILINLDTKPEKYTFSVQDNGIGIPTDDQDKIFSPFFRSKNAAATKIGSLGICLFLTEKIIKKHSGSIGFTSKEGDGSFFWFTLPKE